ncbi:MAG TPA: four helix bundle protein [Candidatus Marinimicrobia bacterium]|nr:four helix bundle protein [Candidatus Neomarinimicrobiota bacterium]HRU92718.1 four helix bundle protein [Candidatus Neomarinimicrobiota bacterium]
MSNNNNENSFRDLLAYKKSFELAMEIFQISKDFPVEEKYSLIDQIRRSSRSVCANLAESYRKRQYEPYFLSKVSDADMENSETQVWIEFSYKCGYLSQNLYNELKAKSEEVGKLINHMLENPEKYRIKTKS